MNKILGPAREIECIDDYDTIVCGGGIAGVSSALAAARNGAKVLLIDRGFMLGGLGTAGLIAIYLPICDGFGHQVSFGIAEELLLASAKYGLDTESELKSPWLFNGTEEEKLVRRYDIQYNPQIYAIELEKILLRENVKVLYGALITDVIVDKDRITHIIIDGKSGPQAISGKTFIDCTGDADIVHLSGENEALPKKGNTLSSWFFHTDNGKLGLSMIGAKDLPEEEMKKVELNEEENTEHLFSGLDTWENSEMMCLSHSSSLNNFLKQGKVTPDHFMNTLATIPQVRWTRRLQGVGTMDESLEHKETEDSVGLFANWFKKGPVFELRYSALYGEKIKNLICAGRNISSNDVMWNLTRVIPVCAVAGQAAGTAAAMTDDFSKLDVKDLQAQLQKDGVVLHEKDLK